MTRKTTCVQHIYILFPNDILAPQLFESTDAALTDTQNYVCLYARALPDVSRKMQLRGKLIFLELLGVCVYLHIWKVVISS